MKVAVLRQLIEELLPAAQASLIFKGAIKFEFPRLLINCLDEDDLPRNILETTSGSLRLINMYGVLSSMRRAPLVGKNPALLANLTSVLEQIELEFPGISTVATTVEAAQAYEQLKKNTM